LGYLFQEKGGRQREGEIRSRASLPLQKKLMIMLKHGVSPPREGEKRRGTESQALVRQKGKKKKKSNTKKRTKIC